MANLLLCDLCGCKVKKNKSDVSIRGRFPLYNGELPPLPKGMKYREEEDGEIGVRYIKQWDNLGKVLKEVHLVEKPPKFRDVRVNYELCETCLEKLMVMFEKLRQHYHLEAKEIEVLSSEKKVGGWGFLEDLND